MPESKVAFLLYIWLIHLNQFLMIKGVLIAYLVTLCCFAHAQNDTTKTFDLGLEFRPRFEYRDGYKQLPSDTTRPAFFVSSRTRLLLDFKQKKSAFHLSLQDVRIWGQNGISSASGTIGVFETYARFALKKNWKITLGRQAVELDNGRLFSRANWNQSSRAHDGIRMDYNTSHFSSAFFAFYNQDKANIFGTSYAQNNYKYLFVNYSTYQAGEHWFMSCLNAFDGYEGITNEQVIFVRGTSGGRIEYKSKPVEATVAAYYQYGQLSSGAPISAYYVQPSIKLKQKKWIVDVGMEYLSGDYTQSLSPVSHSFSTLYGVAFKFMGHLDYFTSFPRDVNGTGLINPYLFVDYNLSDKLRFKLESHLFYTQRDLVSKDNAVVSPYLGFESDFKVKYYVNPDLFLDFGFSIMAATKSMAVLKTGNYAKTPVFSFLMLTWKPKLLSVEQALKR